MENYFPKEIVNIINDATYSQFAVDKDKSLTILMTEPEMVILHVGPQILSQYRNCQTENNFIELLQKYKNYSSTYSLNMRNMQIVNDEIFAHVAFSRYGHEIIYLAKFKFNSEHQCWIAHYNGFVFGRGYLLLEFPKKLGAYKLVL